MSSNDHAEIGAATRVCGVFGHPIRHSASPAMQNAALAALRLDWRYLAFDVLPQDLPQALSGARTMRWIGVNLTVPHKILALGCVDLLDDSAKNFGAVNTVRFEGLDAEEQWRPLGHFDEPPDQVRSHGFNTDAEAVVDSLRQDLNCELAGASVALAGVGGAGKVAALRLAAENLGRLCLINRTESKARETAEEIHRRFPEAPVQIGYPETAPDLLINGTSLGLKPDDPLPVELGRLPLRRVKFVYDMIYRPAETPLLKAAREAGCQTANGLGMLLRQGAKALEIWTGLQAPIDIMNEALKNNVYGAGAACS